MKHFHDGEICYGMLFGCYIGLKEKIRKRGTSFGGFYSNLTKS